MHKAGIAAVLMILTGCGDKPEAHRALTDEQAIAMVNKMNEPPVIPIEPEEITARNIAESNLEDIACGFRQPSDADPIFVAGLEKGWLKLDGRIVELTADRSSDAVASLSHNKYIGLENWLIVSRQGQGTPADPAGLTAEIVIHNENEKVVFRGGGAIECRAGSGRAISSNESAEPGPVRQDPG